MNRIVLASIIGALVFPAGADAATSYCLDGRTADGTWLSKANPSARALGTLAHNGYALGTRVWVMPAVRGRHRWTVRDRIGWGSEADFWAPSCSLAISFGRRAISISPGWGAWEQRRRARAKVRARRYGSGAGRTALRG